MRRATKACCGSGPADLASELSSRRAWATVVVSYPDRWCPTDLGLIVTADSHSERASWNVSSASNTWSFVSKSRRTAALWIFIFVPPDADRPG